MIKAVNSHILLICADFSPQLCVKIIFRFTLEPGVVATICQQHKTEIRQDTGKGFPDACSRMGVVIAVKGDDRASNFFPELQ
jgi:hypothetical protein